MAAITRHGGVASSYDCCMCACPGQYQYTTETPANAFPIPVSINDQVTAQAAFIPACGGSQYFYNITTSTSWSSSSPSIFTLSNNPNGLLHSLAAGTASALAQGPSECSAWYMMGGYSNCSNYTQASGNTSCSVSNPVLVCSLATRGGNVNCGVTYYGNVSAFNWTFTDGTTGTVTVTSPSAGNMWSGVAVQSGVVSVSWTGLITPLTAPLIVSARSGWAFTAVSPQKVANGGGTGDCAAVLVTLISPPPNFSNLGQSCLYQAWSTPSYSQVSGGPNSGYFYLSSPLSNANASHVTMYQWERVPDLENTSSTFYSKQTGTYNAQSNPSGCISGANLAAQTQRHEVGSIQGHWGEYNAAQGNTSNNLGLIAEGQVAVPSTGMQAFQNNVSGALSSAAQAIKNAGSVEPYGVNYDASGNFLGNVNWPPSYNSCQ